MAVGSAWFGIFLLSVDNIGLVKRELKLSASLMEGESWDLVKVM